jgi:glycine betaine catabolism B
MFVVKILEVKTETTDVKTFYFTKPDHYHFIPGQYTLLKFPGSEISRPFTFSSSPIENHLGFTIKKMGEFTTKLFDAQIGDELILDNPKGEALNFNEEVKEDVVFIAGGSGVTPFMSSIKYAVHKNLPNNILLLFGNRTSKDIINFREFNSFNQPNIKIIHCLSGEVFDDWKGETGFIDSNLIAKYVDNFTNKLFYVCGPPIMTKLIKQVLIDLNVNEEQIRMEKWELPSKK